LIACATIHGGRMGHPGTTQFHAEKIRSPTLPKMREGWGTWLVLFNCDELAVGRITARLPVALAAGCVTARLLVGY
jgi:hypothetical protein